MLALPQAYRRPPNALPSTRGWASAGQFDGQGDPHTAGADCPHLRGVPAAVPAHPPGTRAADYEVDRQVNW
jgi:hypothetical protein